MLGTWGAATLSAIAVGLGARGFESKPVRNLLIRLAKTEAGSKDEAAIVKRIAEAMRATQGAENGSD
jgi:hypothetical protein